MASGFPDSVPAWYTGPIGASSDMTSRRPPKAPTGKPPPITLPKHHRSGRTPRSSDAPPAPRRNPVMTSSKISSAPARSHAWRSPSRNPATGATSPMLAATGSTMTAATSAPISGTTLYGTTRVSATAAAGTPADAGSPSVATPLPPPASSPSE